MLYRDAAQFVDNRGAGTLRSRVYGRFNDKNKAKAVYALVSETIKYRHVLDQVLKKAEFFQAEKKFSNSIALLMTYDLLFSKSGRLACGRCPEKDAIIRHKTRLKAELARYTVRNGPPVPKGGDESPVRWIRCNYHNYDAEKLEKHLRSELGLEPTQDLLTLNPRQYYADNNVPGLFGIHPRHTVGKWAIYEAGNVIIQDRASCFPVAMLLPTVPAHKGIYIDACAAPGNKTTQLAAWSQSSVLAFERDPKRAQILHKMTDRAGLGSDITVQVGDFTSSNPSKVSGLIVDPSCSGSGVFGRNNAENENEEASPERLEKLAEFQYAVMSHALRFDAPAAVYSTCSIHSQENEQVVRRLLETPEIAERWQLRSNPLPHWPRRGYATEFEGMENAEQLAAACIRVKPRVDFGIGFFAACFERKM